MIVMNFMDFFHNTDHDRDKQKYLSRGTNMQFDNYTATGSDGRIWNMSYRYAGLPIDKSDIVLVFLHWSPWDASAFDNFLVSNDLGSKYTLVSVDRAGFGDYQYWDGISDIKEQVKLIIPVVDKFPNHKIIIIWHSWWWPIAALTAALYPSKINWTVVMAWSLDPDLEPAVWWRKILDIKYIRRILPNMIKASNTELSDTKNQLTQIVPLWSSYKIPTLIIHGTSDMLVNFGNVNFMQKQMTGADLTIDILTWENHFLINSSVDHSIQQIINFIDKIQYSWIR